MLLPSFFFSFPAWRPLPNHVRSDKYWVLGNLRMVMVSSNNSSYPGAPPLIHSTPGCTSARNLVDASWELRGCVLTITPKLNELSPFIYVISVRHGKLLLRVVGVCFLLFFSRILFVCCFFFLF